MLHELVVENYAVIERVRVRFRPGLNLLTGETGSGKSIVVDALGLLFGGRASPEMIRTGASGARVSGIFEAPREPRWRALLETAGIEIEDSEILVEREILSNARSRAFLCSRPVSATLLRDLAPALGDIHGQHDQQQLFASGTQLEILDQFGGAVEMAEEVSTIFRQWREASRQLAELDSREQEKLRLSDLWAFQKREIEAAAIRPGEDVELESERRVFQNVARLEENARIAYQALYEAPAAALALIRQARRRLEDSSRIDPSLEEALETLRPGEIAIEEASNLVRGYMGRIEADPARLEAIESRLAALDRLKRKYGATLEAVLVFLVEIRKNLDALETSGQRRQQLEADLARLAARYQQAAARLSERRREAARELEKRLEAELRLLAMERTTIRVEFTETEWTERGREGVSFLVSPNPGEEPRPLAKIASGGELSRIALAVKTCTLDAVGKPAAPTTLVFDEVDAGIGGGTAETVGRRLKQIAAAHQVLCVTHLAQIAGFADHHYRVEKRPSRGRTVAFVEELEGPARTREIGRMLSGRLVTPEALRHAEQLLKQAGLSSTVQR